jgi:hypothetical protein
MRTLLKPYTLVHEVSYGVRRIRARRHRIHYTNNRTSCIVNKRFDSFDTYTGGASRNSRIKTQSAICGNPDVHGL